MTGLEALKHLKSLLADSDGYVNIFIQCDMSIVKQELKDYYALKKECEEAKWYHEHKAMKIIKQYPFVVNLDYRLNYGEQNELTKNKLTKEEYDLLKEVLL